MNILIFIYKVNSIFTVETRRKTAVVVRKSSNYGIMYFHPFLQYRRKGNINKGIKQKCSSSKEFLNKFIEIAIFA